MAYGLGVDLGTTFTAAATAGPTTTDMVELGPEFVVPSVVHVAADGTLTSGLAAEAIGAGDPVRLSHWHKRRLGDPTPLMIGGAPYPPSALLAAQLRDVLATTTATRGAPPDTVVLTCPAVWGAYRRELFAEVPRIVGLPAVRVVTEPEAAATHYWSERRLGRGETVAVYDLGGGTFDATILTVRRDGMEILGTPEGVEQLGGIDFDDAILSYVDTRLGGVLSGLDPTDRGHAIVLAEARALCVQAKESLSSRTEVTLRLPLPDGERALLVVTQSEFHDLIRPSVALTIEALHRTIASAALRPADLTAVLLAGGSSRIPVIAQMLTDALGRPVRISLHPKHIVALGAAALARPAAARPAPAAGPTGRRGAPAGRAVPAGQGVETGRRDAKAGRGGGSTGRDRPVPVAIAAVAQPAVALAVMSTVDTRPDGGPRSAELVRVTGSALVPAGQHRSGVRARRRPPRWLGFAASVLAAVAAIWAVATMSPGTAPADRTIDVAGAGPSLSPSQPAIGAGSPTATPSTAAPGPSVTPPAVVATTGPGSSAGHPLTSTPPANSVPRVVTSTLTAGSLTTTSGFVGGGQTVQNLSVADLSGTADVWERYVEFSRGYAGYLTFGAPSGAVSRIELRLNYRGPTGSDQRWTFQLRNWHKNRWDTIGTNDGASDWGPWSTLSFTAGGTLSDYVNAGQGIQVQVTGGPQDDQADIDYAAVVVTATS